MGKRCPQLQKIENKNSRYVTYQKRMRGLVKKAIELANLCEQSVYLAVFDKEKQKFIEY